MIEFDTLKNNWETYESLCNKAVKHGMEDLLEALGERLALCPSSPRLSQYGAHPGGLVEHSLRVTSCMRTLNDAFIILDEAQNTTVEQMKMFLTRVGFGSTTVVTGDITQIDLPKGRVSGLRHVMDVLGDVDEISFTHFNSKDVVRHPLVGRILDAYESHEQTRDRQ